MPEEVSPYPEHGCFHISFGSGTFDLEWDDCNHSADKASGWPY